MRGPTHRAQLAKRARRSNAALTGLQVHAREEPGVRDSGTTW